MTVANILAGSEPVAYGDEIISMEMNSKDVFVISDLHLGAGLNTNGNYDGTENFFADKSFFRFLNNIVSKKQSGKKQVLIINGDFIDFLRIRNIPLTPDDFREWSHILNDLGISRTVATLQSSIVQKEVEYGFKTDDYKSVWKLYVCYLGHDCVFETLANWLSQGNELIVVKGNHDLEWYWKTVRDYLRLLLAKKISSVSQSDPLNELRNVVIPQVNFVDDKLIIDKTIYIEHGHRYENFTTVKGPPVLENSTELNLPFGSFFNRYLINRIELAYPYIDDIRPRKKILPLLIRERFPLAIQMLFRYIPFTILIIPKKQYLYALRYLLQFIWIILIPLGVTISAIYESLHHTVAPASGTSKSSFIWQYILPQLKNLLFLSLSYFLGRLFSMFSLSAPTTFYPNAQKVFLDHQGIIFVTFGHTHDPEQKRTADKAYYNTGTWIPVYELDAANVRLDKTYTFLQFSKAESGKIETMGLMRWNDDAGRSEVMELRDSI